MLGSLGSSTSVGRNLRRLSSLSREVPRVRVALLTRWDGPMAAYDRLGSSPSITNVPPPVLVPGVAARTSFWVLADATSHGQRDGPETGFPPTMGYMLFSALIWPQDVQRAPEAARGTSQHTMGHVGTPCGGRGGTGGSGTEEKVPRQQLGRPGLVPYALKLQKYYTYSHSSL